jgi:hypothetical protein
MVTMIKVMVTVEIMAMIEMVSVMVKRACHLKSDPMLYACWARSVTDVLTTPTTLRPNHQGW